MAKDNRRSSGGSALITMALHTRSSTSFGDSSSMISAITLDDALCSSERYSSQRFDPTLESLKEQKWAANDNKSSCFSELRHPSSVHRFALQGTDATLCKPQRKPDNELRTSTSSTVDYRTSNNFLRSSNFFLEEEILDISRDELDDNNGIEEDEFTLGGPLNRWG